MEIFFIKYHKEHQEEQPSFLHSASSKVNYISHISLALFRTTTYDDAAARPYL